MDKLDIKHTHTHTCYNEIHLYQFAQNVDRQPIKLRWLGDTVIWELKRIFTLNSYTFGILTLMILMKLGDSRTQIQRPIYMFLELEVPIIGPHILIYPKAMVFTTLKMRGSASTLFRSGNGIGDQNGNLWLHCSFSVITFNLPSMAELTALR